MTRELERKSLVWQRRRSPEDVPTPLAVAVSDFCRRANAPTSASEIREALSLLSSHDDFRVRMTTDGEPAATPLGPYAVVDLIHGTSAALASARQQCGYYELVKLFVEYAPKAISAEPVPLRPAQTSPNRAASQPAASKYPTLSEKVAPQKRPQSSPTKSALLKKPETAAVPVTPIDEPLKVVRHSPPEAKGPSFDRATLLSSFEEHQGSESKASWALGVSLAALRQMVKTAGLQGEIEKLRGRYRDEIMAEKGLSQRLEMAGRYRYLDDLGIREAFLGQLKTDLGQWVHAQSFNLKDEESVPKMAKTLGVSTAVLSKMIKQLS